METKQTAVEWLFKQLWEEPKDKMVWYAILDKAKEKEKEQIMDAHNQGYADGYRDNGKFPIEYYNETYGSKTES
jgi:hypothetical protein